MAQPPKKRTAVLVVHGMGSQRALSTLRGVVNAVWLDKDGPPGRDDKRYWLHPEKRNGDVDLPVITTNEIPLTVDRRSADFHELYWAHLMSETRAVAVLLWLFELVRKGPRLKQGMKALWWGATIFLCLLIQSVVLLSLHAILQFLGNPPLIDSNKVEFAQSAPDFIRLWNHGYYEPEALLLAPFFVVFMVASYVLFFSAYRGALGIALAALIIAVLAGKFFYVGTNFEYEVHRELVMITVRFLPIGISLCVAAIAMGRWGAIAMLAAYLLSSAFFILYLDARYLILWENSGVWAKLKDIFVVHHGNIFAFEWKPNPFSYVWDQGWIFWSLNERYSAVIAVAIILIYLAVYALFLQPFLGDAARYFRPSPGNVLVRRRIRTHAVETLEALHKWGTYDRVIVVAHSLGTVVAYDMLRTYFSRVNKALPSPADLEPQFSSLDSFEPEKPSVETSNEFRSAGRQLIRSIAAQTVNSQDVSRHGRPTWLVTDFITLGSPLTHAHYLMCEGRTEAALVSDFRRRVAQREFPTCPPERQDDGGLLGFKNRDSGQIEFDHAALFAMTRWTNLYFPMKQLLWGDAIGGPLAGIFGRYVKDVAISTCEPPSELFFTHTAYWSCEMPGGREAPHIGKLREAMNLEDK
ncbi:hypothetical protein AYJ54_36505 [Bradyrhizobium centrolobii]|uniref:Uncharacterized protein n=1 Tax=Bradyrhizobium centrolobii TaxID=1505087 RepID=A0A176Y812_9BRAD|nr:hypothetical protein [Bradyrhizobium centrolobii]OAE96779.1 hypothetical protein AYJ54_36505 [Bradyrhizobium centrolobii]